jgi:hypothetical protein
MLDFGSPKNKSPSKRASPSKREGSPKRQCREYHPLPPSVERRRPLRRPKNYTRPHRGCKHIEENVFLKGTVTAALKERDADRLRRETYSNPELYDLMTQHTYAMSEAELRAMYTRIFKLREDLAPLDEQDKTEIIERIVATTMEERV